MGPATTSAATPALGAATTLEDLPEACVILILAKLGKPLQVCRVAQINKTFASASSSDQLWESFFPEGCLEDVSNGTFSAGNPSISEVNPGQDFLSQVSETESTSTDHGAFAASCYWNQPSRGPQGPCSTGALPTGQEPGWGSPPDGLVCPALGSVSCQEALRQLQNVPQLKKELFKQAGTKGVYLRHGLQWYKLLLGCGVPSEGPRLAGRTQKDSTGEPKQASPQTSVFLAFSVLGAGVAWGTHSAWEVCSAPRGSYFGHILRMRLVQWFEIQGEVKVHLPPGRYTVTWRLALRRKFGVARQPVEFGFSSNTGMELAGEFAHVRRLSLSYGDFPIMKDKWVEVDVGDLVIGWRDGLAEEVDLKFWIRETQGQVWKAGLEIDCLIIRPLRMLRLFPTAKLSQPVVSPSLRVWESEGPESMEVGVSGQTKTSSRVAGAVDSLGRWLRHVL